MKLLFDHYLSPHLVLRLADLYPDSAHVFTLGLDRASDAEVWSFSREKGYTIVTQDADYSDILEAGGFPPKVVWVRRGNRSTNEMETLLRTHREAIEALLNDPGAGVLVLL